MTKGTVWMTQGFVWMTQGTVWMTQGFVWMTGKALIMPEADPPPRPRRGEAEGGLAGNE
jgi:hypothetical protein